jgi:spore maturation protein CgeB
MRPRRILLVGPAFHGYTTTIGEALRRRGHEATVHLYDAHSGTAARVRTKLVSELPDRLGLSGGRALVKSRTTAAARAVLDATRPDLVLAIKADAVAPSFWEHAHDLGARTHLWLYDELRRMVLDPEVLEAVDLVTSYSRLDAAALLARGLDASHVANAFDAAAPFHRVDSTDVLFIGARYPNRERLLLDLHGRGVPVRAVGRDWSHHPFDRLRTWDVRRPDLPAARDVSRPTSYGLMAGAVANLNMHHDQDGFTMRTFEIPGSGGVQLVDRPDVCDYYELGSEVLVYRDVDEAADLIGRVEREPAWARAIAEAGRARTRAEHTFDHRVKDLEALWTG